MQELVEIESWLLVIDLFEIFVQAIKLVKFHCLIIMSSDV